MTERADRLTTIASWLQDQAEELLYDPDELAAVQAGARAAPRAALRPAVGA